MNLPNRITLARIIFSFIIVGVLIFPFDAAGIVTYKLFVNEAIVIDIKYLIVGVLFIIAALTDKIDGKIARKYNMVTDLGKMLDAIADKVLINSVLIILSTSGFIHPIIPVLIVGIDTIIYIIKMVAGSKGNIVEVKKIEKVKSLFIMSGIVLTLFYNMPFELWNIRIADILLIIGCVLSIVSAIEYYNLNKKTILKD